MNKDPSSLKELRRDKLTILDFGIFKVNVIPIANIAHGPHVDPSRLNSLEMGGR